MVMISDVVTELSTGKYDNNRLMKANQRLGDNAKEGEKAGSATIKPDEISANFRNAD
jgi:hypothetical protein